MLSGHGGGAHAQHAGGNGDEDRPVLPGNEKGGQGGGETEGGGWEWTADGLRGQDVPQAQLSAVRLLGQGVFGHDQKGNECEGAGGKVLAGGRGGHGHQDH